MANPLAIGRPKDVYPYPTNKKEREAAKLLHLKAKQEGKRIPYFIKDGDPTNIHYFDNKGKGKLGLNNLNTKLTNEAGRAANKKNLTPTLAMYIEEFGEETGKALHKIEYDKVKAIYKANNPMSHDVDHIISQADLGVHGSRNLRSQELTINRSEGARGRVVPKKKYERWKTDLMVGAAPKDYIRLQGPELTKSQTLNYLADKPLDTVNELTIKKNGNGNGNGKNGNGHINGKNGKRNGLTTGGGKTRTLDSVLQIGTNIGTGNYGGAAIGVGTLGAAKVLQNSAVQRRVASQVAKLIAERGAKTTAKLIPGLDVALSAKESWDYLKQGNLDQAGIAALSGAIGWLPLIGDGASAALDLSNTGLDIARLNIPNRKNRKKLKRTTRRLKLAT